MYLVTENCTCITDPYWACVRKITLDIAYSIPGYEALHHKEKRPIYDAIHNAVITKDADTIASIINKDLPWWDAVDADEIAALLQTTFCPKNNA